MQKRSDPRIAEAFQRFHGSCSSAGNSCTSQGNSHQRHVTETFLNQALTLLSEHPGFDELISTTNDNNQTLAHLAVSLGFTSLLNSLVGWSIDVGIADVNGFTALHCAYLKGDQECIDILLSSGASELVKDNQGRLPDDLASNVFKSKKIDKVAVSKCAELPWMEEPPSVESTLLTVPEPTGLSTFPSNVPDALNTPGLFDGDKVKPEVLDQRVDVALKAALKGATGNQTKQIKLVSSSEHESDDDDDDGDGESSWSDDGSNEEGREYQQHQRPTDPPSTRNNSQATESDYDSDDNGDDGEHHSPLARAAKEAERQPTPEPAPMSTGASRVASTPPVLLRSLSKSSVLNPTTQEVTASSSKEALPADSANSHEASLSPQKATLSPRGVRPGNRLNARPDDVEFSDPEDEGPEQTDPSPKSVVEDGGSAKAQPEAVMSGKPKSTVASSATAVTTGHTPVDGPESQASIEFPESVVRERCHKDGKSLSYFW